MIDPLSYFTVTAIASGAIEAGKWAFSGLVGNSFNAAFWRTIPQIQQWYQGEGQPVNHDLQRALRIAYLAATGQLLEHVRSEVDEDTLPWFYRGLQWVNAQSELLKDQNYRPPEPPGGWEPAYIVEPAGGDEAIAALRESLAAMLLGEWSDAKLGTPPEAAVQALAHGWTESERKCDWFQLISLYFDNEVKTNARVQAIFLSTTVAKILTELRQFRREFKDSQSPPTAHAFFAPSAPDFFVGRDTALQTLATRLAEPGAVVPLIGMAGLGKTSLAIAFAHRHRDDFEGVYWIDCSGQSLAASTARLADQLAIRPEGEPETQLREIRRQCAERHCLLVLDNVESNETRGLIPEGSAAVLVTTRRDRLPFLLAKYRPPELNLFTPEECLALFQAHLGPADVSANESDYLKLAGQLGRLPIAIAVAAGLLKNDLRWTLPRLLAEAKPHRLAHGELDIGALLRAAIASAGEQARGLLSAMAVCAPSGFRLNLAAEIAQIDGGSALDTLEDDLRSRSLVEIVDREKLRCRLHSLIRAEAGQDAALEQRHAEAVARRFRSWENSWRECEEDMDDWRLALAWAGEEKSPPSERIGLLAALAFSGFFFTHRRGLLTDSLQAMKAVAAAYEKAGDRAGLQASYGNQALILRDWGRLEEAMALHKKEEAICLDLGDRAGLQASYGNQALILQAWGRLEEAMALLQKQEAICLELGDRAGLQRSYGNQALILRDWGRLEEAMALLQKQEAICLELGDRAGLQASYGNQALILQAWGRLEEAMALHKKAEAICLELGDRAGLGSSYGNQALILKAWGRPEEAMALHKKEEAIGLELGDRAGLQRSYGNQALILKAWGRVEEAMALLQKQEAICLELGDRAGLQRSYGNQALILKAWGRMEEAMALHKKEEIVCRELGDRDGLQASYGNQALILKAWGRLEEAMALHKKEEAICLELGDRAGLQASYGNQAVILQDWGRLEEAMALHKKEEIVCRELGLRDDLRISLKNQAILLDAMGQTDEASRLRAEAEAIHAEIMRGREASA